MTCDIDWCDEFGKVSTPEGVLDGREPEAGGRADEKWRDGGTA